LLKVPSAGPWCWWVECLGSSILDPVCGNVDLLVSAPGSAARLGTPNSRIDSSVFWVSGSVIGHPTSAYQNVSWNGSRIELRGWIYYHRPQQNEPDASGVVPGPKLGPRYFQTFSATNIFANIANIWRFPSGAPRGALRSWCVGAWESGGGAVRAAGGEGACRGDTGAGRGKGCWRDDGGGWGGRCGVGESSLLGIFLRRPPLAHL
jgi:hypothetical protein